MDTRQLLAKLEELGIHGKKAQSTLTEHEIALVHPEVLQPEFQPVVGQERLVAERVVTEIDQGGDHMVTAREEVRESRISSTTIRRRATRTVLHEEEAPAVELSHEEQISAPVPEPFVPPLAAVPFELPVVEPVTIVPEMPVEATAPIVPSSEPAVVSTAPEEPPVSVGSQEETPLPSEEASPSTPAALHDEASAQFEPESPRLQEKEESIIPSSQISQAAQKPMPSPPPPVKIASPPAASLDAPARPRILGRIDLAKLKEASEFRPPEVRTRPQAPPPSSPVSTPAHVLREPAVETGGAPIDSGTKRPKKRKVIRKTETTEVPERDLKITRGAKKKRIQLPGKEQRQTEITLVPLSIGAPPVSTAGSRNTWAGVLTGELGGGA